MKDGLIGQIRIIQPFNIKKRTTRFLKSYLLLIQAVSPQVGLVDGVEADAAPSFSPTVSAEVKKGDILTVEVTQGGESNKSCVAIRPIVKYTLRN